MWRVFGYYEALFIDIEDVLGALASLTTEREWDEKTKPAVQGTSTTESLSNKRFRRATPQCSE
jgi:hypothetical protein